MTLKRDPLRTSKVIAALTEARPMKPYKQTTFDPGNNLFAIAIDDAGNQVGIGRIDTITQLRTLIHCNWMDGRRTEVAVLGLSQVEAVMKRVTG